MTRRAPLRWKPPHVIHRCEHCRFRSDRTAAAYVHSVLHRELWPPHKRAAA